MSNYNFNYEYNNNQDGLQSSMDISSNGPPKRDLSNQHLRPVTIKQILNAPIPIADGPFKLNGRNLDHISIIGKIQKSQTNSLNTVYIIEDGTGSIEVKIWIDTNDPDMELQRASQYGENVYIRVIGTARYFNNKKGVMAFHIHLIEDFNEITSHFLEIIKINLEDMKNGNIDNSQAKPLPSFNDSAYAPPTTNTNSAPSFPPCQQAILDIFKAQQENGQLTEDGLHKNILFSMLRGKFSEEEIKESLEFLISECHIYATSADEQHVNISF